MSHLIDASELAASQSDVRLFDCRSALTDKGHGARAYAAGHLPGALFADLENDLSSPVITGQTGRHPLPTRDTFAATCRAWGLTADAAVVAYDDGPGAFAARLWWMLRWIGIPNVRVLDGGLSSWVAAGHPLSTEFPDYDRSTFEPGAAVTREVTAAELDTTQQVVIDARDRERYLGHTEPVDPVAGHIPGAHCLPFADNLRDGRFLPVADLETRFRALATPRDNVVCYCGSGVTAAHNILALVEAGYPEPALYAGSWSEWIQDPLRPIASEVE